MQRFDPMLARAMLRARLISNREVARSLGCSEAWVARVLLGRAAAPQAFVTGLARVLDVEEAQLRDPADVAK